MHVIRRISCLAVAALMVAAPGLQAADPPGDSGAMQQRQGGGQAGPQQLRNQYQYQHRNRNGKGTGSGKGRWQDDGRGPGGANTGGTGMQRGSGRGYADGVYGPGRGDDAASGSRMGTGAGRGGSSQGGGGR